MKVRVCTLGIAAMRHGEYERVGNGVSFADASLPTGHRPALRYRKLFRRRSTQDNELRYLHAERCPEHGRGRPNVRFLYDSE